MGNTGKPRGGCSVENCTRPHKGRGLCRVHYMRLRKHGDVHADVPIVEKTAKQWIRDHVGWMGDACLTWPFTRTVNGRGTVTATVVGRARGNMPAARAMCILAHGEPPTPKHHAAHTCGRGHEGCVNPRHLCWKTPKQNAADTLRHGTRRTLVGVARRDLKSKHLRAIKLLAPHFSDAELAELFGCTLGQVERTLGRASAHKPHLYRRAHAGHCPTRDTR